MSLEEHRERGRKLFIAGQFSIYSYGCGHDRMMDALPAFPNRQCAHGRFWLANQQPALRKRIGSRTGVPRGAFRRNNCHQAKNRPSYWTLPMLVKYVTQILTFAGFATLLFISAGTWRWPAAWVLLGEMALCTIALGLWLKRHDPALLVERGSSYFQSTQRPLDKLFVGV